MKPSTETQTQTRRGCRRRRHDGRQILAGCSAALLSPRYLSVHLLGPFWGPSRRPPSRRTLTGVSVSGVKCKEDAVFVYSRIGGDLLLPCSGLLLPDCSTSPVSWTFFRSSGSFHPEEIGRDLTEAGSHGAGRVSITWNCSVSLRGLQAEDAGSYACLRNRSSVVTFYLSLLTITSPSTITSLQPGGQLSLSCVLFTYFDAGNCRSYSMFNLSWVSGDGATLPTDNRSTNSFPS